MYVRDFLITEQDISVGVKSGLFEHMGTTEHDRKEMNKEVIGYIMLQNKDIEGEHAGWTIAQAKAN